MSGLATKLFNEIGVDLTNDQGEFAPVARYYAGMDFMLYLSEDCSYRADRVDQFLTILLHPTEDRAVGVKLKGFKFLFDRLTNVVDGLDQRHFYPLVKVFEIALVGSYAQTIIDQDAQSRIQSRYAEAKDLTENVEFDTSDMQKAA